MNRFGSLGKPFVRIAALSLVAVLAGCGSGGNGISGFGSTGGVCSGASCVSLGAAGNYVILAKTGISTVPACAITGNLGLSPAAASFITGFSLTADSTNVFSRSSQVTGKVYAADYAPPTPTNLTTAVQDMMTAYTDAAGRAPGTTDSPPGGAIGGTTIPPGVYKWTSGVSIGTDVTLSGTPTDV